MKYRRSMIAMWRVSVHAAVANDALKADVVRLVLCAAGIGWIGSKFEIGGGLVNVGESKWKDSLKQIEKKIHSCRYFAICAREMTNQVVKTKQ